MITYDYHEDHEPSRINMANGAVWLTLSWRTTTPQVLNIVCMVHSDDEEKGEEGVKVDAYDDKQVAATLCS